MTSITKKSIKDNIIIKKAKSNGQQFRDFLLEHRVMSLAVAVVIGNAAKELINSIVNNLVMPIIGILTPSGSWREISFTILNSEFGVGNFLGSLIDFIIIAILVFVITKKILKSESNSTKVKK